MKNNKRTKTVVLTALITFITVTSALTGFILTSGKKPVPVTSENDAYPQSNLTEEAFSNQTTAITEESTTAEADPTPYIVSTVTIGSAGDVLIHKPILESANEGNSVYSFNKLFTYVSPVTLSYDYFLLNLETTLAGNEGRNYSTYPCFNTPDSLLDSLYLIGTDCLLTANNHSYDTGESGFLRTVETVDSAGFDHTGTYLTADESRYLIKNIKGIDFGFICYTYETPLDSSTIKALNGINMNATTSGLINSFDYDHLDTFYADIENQLFLMKEEGADVLTVYMHWGDEYKLSANSWQKTMAQKLCDMGVDVIIGGHPHVVEPIELLTSSDGESSTVCIYSVGNFVSNQRRNLMGLKTGHTEDGVIFEMTFTLYSDGTVYFQQVDVTPTWVHLYTENGKKVHAVTPLSENMDASSLGLDKSSDGFKNAEESYERTMALVGSGLEECNAYLKENAPISQQLKGGIL